MKSHGMFFDENYSEDYYRVHSVMSYLDKVDCLIVCGTTLQTGIPLQVVKHCLTNNIQIIEVSYPDSQIPIGK
jgi:NAD-dependent SIR2 family protein deacetylase